MKFVYFININAAVLLLFWPVWFVCIQLHLPWINPFLIIGVFKHDVQR